MSEETPPTTVDYEDCLGLLRVYKDGSTRRTSNPIFNVPVNPTPSVTFQDATFDHQNNLQLRLYKPTQSSTAQTKLPIVIHIHGGGFCVGSNISPASQNSCFRLASQLESIVISPAYRLAPESRLPAAIDDGYAALKWLRDQAAAEPWLSYLADFGKVFVLGESAGGNIAHNLAVRVGTGSGELGPVEVKGYVLLYPFFGGVERTKSEAEAPEDSLLNLDLVDWFLRHSVPVGETSDYPTVNPFGPGSKDLQEVELGPMLVISGGDDLLVDRIRDYAEKLKQMGKRIQYAEFEGQSHGFTTMNPDSEAASSVMDLIKKFIIQHSN